MLLQSEEARGKQRTEAAGDFDESLRPGSEIRTGCVPALNTPRTFQAMQYKSTDRKVSHFGGPPYSL